MNVIIVGSGFMGTGLAQRLIHRLQDALDTAPPSPDHARQLFIRQQAHRLKIAADDTAGHAEIAAGSGSFRTAGWSAGLRRLSGRLRRDRPPYSIKRIMWSEVGPFYDGTKKEKAASDSCRRIDRSLFGCSSFRRLPIRMRLF